MESPITLNEAGHQGQKAYDKKFHGQYKKQLNTKYNTEKILEKCQYLTITKKKGLLPTIIKLHCRGQILKSICRKN